MDMDSFEERPLGGKSFEYPFFPLKKGCSGIMIWYVHNWFTTSLSLSIEPLHKKADIHETLYFSG